MDVNFDPLKVNPDLADAKGDLPRVKPRVANADVDLEKVEPRGQKLAFDVSKVGLGLPNVTADVPEVKLQTQYPSTSIPNHPTRRVTGAGAEKVRGARRLLSAVVFNEADRSVRAPFGALGGPSALP